MSKDTFNIEQKRDSLVLEYARSFYQKG